MHSLLCDTSLGGLSLDFTANSPLQSVTLYLFLSATLAFGAAAAFFLLMRREVDPPYRTTMVLSTLIWRRFVLRTSRTSIMPRSLK